MIFDVSRTGTTVSAPDDAASRFGSSRGGALLSSAGASLSCSSLFFFASSFAGIGSAAGALDGLIGDLARAALSAAPQATLWRARGRRRMRRSLRFTRLLRPSPPGPYTCGPAGKGLDTAPL